MTEESSPDRRSSVWWLTLFLAGPVIWYLYFWLVYVVAETGCTLGDPELRVFGVSGVSLFTLVSTVMAALVIIWATLLTFKWRRRGRAAVETDENGQHAARREERRFLLFGGLLLGVLFLIATLFVGIPALVLSPC